MKLRDEALAQLEYFSQKKLGSYALNRNFDLGNEKQSSVSKLSKFITHRIIDEWEVIQSAYNKFSFKKIEKFIQEIFWRTYWKGWLELRPQVWDDYNKDLNNLLQMSQDKDYLRAIAGNTNIACFNDWVVELKNSGYLHNHARMWFASIWIFTLNLPWQLGADFFLKHLIDGDAASNTLSWRWVAGLHTKGKHYLATEWNINKFSSKKYENLHLNEKANSKIENKDYAVNAINYDEIKQKKSLFLYHNLEFSLSDTTEIKENYIYGLIDFNTTLKDKNYSTQVLDFKDKINNELKNKIKNKFNSEIYIQTIEDLQKIILEKNIEQIILPYITISYENDFIKTIKKDLSIVYQAKEYDKYCWQFTTKGYFAFKEQIPKILAKFL